MEKEGGRTERTKLKLSGTYPPDLTPGKGGGVQTKELQTNEKSGERFLLPILTTSRRKRGGKSSVHSQQRKKRRHPEQQANSEKGPRYS